ncbi:MAG: AMP-binding protein, partial [Myxococcales bacterium]|nr:AMP-binding protein [Myxococcales bacterium]
FQTFVDDVIVHNRMMTGGFVIAGRSVTLADITAPVLCFVGERDEFARPRAVRAIDRAAPRAPLFERSADAGHFGLVVGAGALETTWSTVTRWVLWRAGKGPQPAEIVDVRGGGRARQRAARAGGDDLIGEVREAIWDQLGLGLRDVTESARWVRWQVPRLLSLVPVLLRGRVNIGRLLAERAAARPNDTLFLWRGRAYSYAEADARVNKLARALLARGVSPKGHVGILMDNHPDYLTSLLALSRIGAVAVLLNPGVRGPVLEHALAAGKVEQILTSPERAAAAVEAAGADAVARVYLVSAHSEASAALGLESLHERVQADGDDGPPQGLALNPGRAEELAWLMFTSGTTGRPKAAKMTNSRVLGAATLAAVGAGMTARDTVYVSLPLYHATGLVLGATAGFIAGSRVVLAPRFSVSRFWDDVRRHGVTVVLYVGELCRFLINTPEAANEKRHTIRLLVGNGMREDVWREVLRRFGGIRVLEFYAATEGNILLANLTGEKVGSVGRVPFDVLRTELLRYDFERGEVARDDDGNVMLCDDDEPGMLIGQIHPLNPFSRFDGYTDARATGKKIIHNVFTVGDAWFLSGDILRRDADGDFWFVDRVGDTFRWRGENVSTEEVEAVLRAAPGVEQVAVYGIEIAGEEGRAGMAALTLQPGTAALDGAALYEVAESSLAPRARPLFVRVVDALETTVTFKVIKRGLQEQGASLEAAGAGRLFRLDEPARRYAPVESER